MSTPGTNTVTCVVTSAASTGMLVFNSVLDYELFVNKLTEPKTSASMSAGAGAGAGVGVEEKEEGVDASRRPHSESKTPRPGFFRGLFSKAKPEVSVREPILFSDIVAAYVARQSIREKLSVIGNVKINGQIMGLKFITENPLRLLQDHHFRYSSDQQETVLDHLPFLLTSLEIDTLRGLNIQVTQQQILQFMKENPLHSPGS